MIRSLAFLALSLLVTPLRTLTKIQALHGLRKVFGLASFVYAMAHVYLYASNEISWKWNYLMKDVFSKDPSRQFLLYGVIAFSCMVPLAMTSNDCSRCVHIIGYSFISVYIGVLKAVV